MTFEAGQTVGEYKVVRALGRGGLGAVYEAVHQISQRAEAMKVMLPERTGTPDMKERFRREIQLLASLNHPNIARLHNAFYFEDQLIMIMELVEGEDLRSRSRNRGIPLPMLMNFAMQVLAALDYAHARGVVHRDIKPANIMVSPVGLVKVLDFGIAISQGSTELTMAGSLIGSPMHMSPEQIRGEKATQQSDIYSLGVTLYELIAGRPPVNGGTTYELMMAHLNQTPMPLAEIRPDVPARLSAVISKALEKEPAKRFSNRFGLSGRSAFSELRGSCRCYCDQPSGPLARGDHRKGESQPITGPLRWRNRWSSWCGIWHPLSDPLPRSSCCGWRSNTPISTSFIWRRRSRSRMTRTERNSCTRARAPKPVHPPFIR